VKCWEFGPLVEEVMLDQLTLADDTLDEAGGAPQQ
jgi:hypothetical protein